MRSDSTPDDSVKLMAGSQSDHLSRLAPARVSRGKDRVYLAPATTTSSTVPPPTTAKPRPVVKKAPPTTAKPKTQTVAAPKPAPKSTPPAPTNPNTPTTAHSRPMPAAGGSSSSEEGKASWYNAGYHESNPWICAHKTIPKGTVLTVTNVRTGGSITCEVGDRGPYVEGRILDLSKYAFSRLANPSAGLIYVRITW